MTERSERSFAELVAGREGEFPVLARAVRDQGPRLQRLQVEWMLDVPVKGEPGVGLGWRGVMVV